MEIDEEYLDRMIKIKREILKEAMQDLDEIIERRNKLEEDKEGE